MSASVVVTFDNQADADRFVWDLDMCAAKARTVGPPALELSDAERKLDEIRKALDGMDRQPFAMDAPLPSATFAEHVRAILNPPPPRVPQVGDTVRHKQDREDVRSVLDVLDASEVLRLTAGTSLGCLVVTHKWEVVE